MKTAKIRKQIFKMAERPNLRISKNIKLHFKSLVIKLKKINDLHACWFFIFTRSKSLSLYIA